MAKQKFHALGAQVAVDWEDAWFADDDNGLMEPMPLTRIGFVIEHSAVGIKVSAEAHTKLVGEFSRKVQFIPATCIRNIRKLKG